MALPPYFICKNDVIGIHQHPFMAEIGFSSFDKESPASLGRYAEA